MVVHKVAVAEVELLWWLFRFTILIGIHISWHWVLLQSNPGRGFGNHTGWNAIDYRVGAGGNGGTDQDLNQVDSCTQ